MVQWAIDLLEGASLAGRGIERKSPLLNKLLQWVGLAAILGGCALSIAGFLNVREHVTLVVREPVDPQVADPMAVLADDLAVLRNDLRAFATGLAGEFDRLATRLETTQASRVELAHCRLDSLEGRLPALVSGRGENSAPVPRAGTHDRTDEGPAADHTDQDKPPASKEPARKSFLSFQLPAESFDLDRPQRFDVIGSLSRVGFDAKSTLHNFSGVTSRVRGVLEIAPGAADRYACGGRVEVEAGSLHTGVEGRDTEMFHCLAVAEHPQLTFDLEGFEASSVERDAQRVRGVLSGTLTIAGRARQVRVPVVLTVDESRRLAISGEFPVLMSDFEVRPPTKLGVLSVEDEIQVWVVLRARAAGPASGLAGKSP